MHIITNLTPNLFGADKVFTGCCDSEVEFIVELDPGDADHEIDTVYLYAVVGSTLEIYEVGATPYTTTPGSSVNVSLTPTFVLTQGNQLSIKFKYCPGIAVGGFDNLQLTLACANHGGYHNFTYIPEAIDISPAFNSIIAESSAIYTSCSTDCDIKKDLLHFNNISGFNLPVTSTLSTACGFNFFIDGNPIDITDFQMPVGQSVLQINNPGCIVPVACNFNIDFDFCGNVVSIPITHEIVNCGPCGIDCRGISISTTPVSMPKVAIAPDYAYGPQYSNPVNASWVWAANIGDTQTTTYSTNGIKAEETSFISGSTSAYLAPYAIWPSLAYTYSPTFNNTDHVTLYWYLETGDTNNSTWEVNYSGLLTGGSPISLIPLGSLFPNTVYQGSIDIPSFVDPGAVVWNQGYFEMINSTLALGDYLEIKNARLQLQQYVKPNLITQADLDCSTLNSYNTTAIGDEKTITFQYYYHNGFADFTQVFFNPWAFDGSADFTTKYPGGIITQPYSGFVVDVMSGWINGGPQQMNFLGPNNQKNYKAYINIINGNEFEIILEFFLIQDLLDWVDLYDLDNQRKLLYSSADPSTPILTNLVNSVYLNTKAFGSLLYIVDPNIITQYTGTPPKPVYYECYLDTKVMFDVRWWGQGIGGSLSEMSNASFAFDRNSNPVTQLSTINKTTVVFNVYYSGVIDNVIFWLFDTANFDNSVDFYDNYDSSRALIPTIVTSGVIDNHLESPSQAVTSMEETYSKLQIRSWIPCLP